MSAAQNMPLIGTGAGGRVTAAFAALAAGFVEWLAGGVSWVFGFTIVNIPFGEIGMLFALLALIAVAQVTSTAAADADRGSPINQLNAAVWVAATFVGLAFVYNFADGIEHTAWLVAYAFIAGFILLIVFHYFQHRARVARRETAMRRTSRSVRRSFEGWGETLAAAVAVVAAVAIGLFSGIIEGLGPVGDALSPFLGELAYLWVGLVGYLALGGELMGETVGWAQGMSPAWWFGLVLFVGGLVVFFRD